MPSSSHRNYDSLRQIRRVRRSGCCRRGGAIVELALCLPVLVMVTLATIEACAMIHLKQALKITAYEGARVGIVPESQAANVQHQCEALLDDFGVRGYAIGLNPADPTTLSQGDYLQVTVSSNFGSNSLIGGWIYTNQIVSASVSLRAE